MRRKTLFIILILIVLSADALAAKAPLSKYSDYLDHLAMHIGENTASATGNYIKIRQKPNGDKVVGHLEMADVFSIDDVSGKWIRITVIQSDDTSPDSWNGLSGWIDGNYIDCRCDEKAYKLYSSKGDEKSVSQAKKLYYNPELTENCSSYEELIDLYTDAAQNIKEYPSEYLVNFFVEPYTSFSGYMYFDVNRDGTDELLFLDKPNYEEAMIYAVYTMKNGKPHRVFDGWTRRRLYLLSDGTFFSCGSDGASYSSEYIYEIRNGNAVFLEGYASSDYITEQGEYGWGWFRVLDGSYPALGLTDQMILVNESEYYSWEYPERMSLKVSDWISF